MAPGPPKVLPCLPGLSQGPPDAILEPSRALPRPSHGCPGALRQLPACPMTSLQSPASSSQPAVRGRPMRQAIQRNSLADIHFEHVIYQKWSYARVDRISSGTSRPKIFRAKSSGASRPNVLRHESTEDPPAQVDRIATSHARTGTNYAHSLMQM